MCRNRQIRGCSLLETKEDQTNQADPDYTRLVKTVNQRCQDAIRDGSWSPSKGRILDKENYKVESLYYTVVFLQNTCKSHSHYNCDIMSKMASQITGVSIVCSTVCSGADQRKHQSSASLAFVQGNPRVIGEFPSQRVSKVENVSIWWRHHAITRPWGRALGCPLCVFSFMGVFYGGFPEF